MEVYAIHDVKHLIKKLLLEFSGCKVDLHIPGISNRQRNKADLMDVYEFAKYLANCNIKDNQIIEWSGLLDSENQNIEMFLSWQNESGTCVVIVFKENT